MPEFIIYMLGMEDYGQGFHLNAPGTRYLYALSSASRSRSFPIQVIPQLKQRQVCTSRHPKVGNKHPYSTILIVGHIETQQNNLRALEAILSRGGHFCQPMKKELIAKAAPHIQVLRTNQVSECKSKHTTSYLIVGGPQISKKISLFTQLEGVVPNLQTPVTLKNRPVFAKSHLWPFDQPHR